MRKVLATAFVSLDGVMQAPGGPEEDPTGGFKYGGWTAPYWDDAIGQVMGGIFNVPYELLLGRKTYEIFNAHWPHAKDDPFADALNNVRKYVATTSEAPLTWKNSIAIHDVPKEIARLKREDGPTLMTQGSSDLIQTLLKHDLIRSLHVARLSRGARQGQAPVRHGHAPGDAQAGRLEGFTVGRDDQHLRARGRSQGRLVRPRPAVGRGARATRADEAGGVSVSHL